MASGGPVVHFEPADPAVHRDTLRTITEEYVRWVFDGFTAHFGVDSEKTLGITVPAYVEKAVETVCVHAPPAQLFYLVWRGEALVGTGGLRGIAPGVAEIKRVYVRPTHQGLGLGGAIMERLLADARANAYTRVCLDTAPYMTAAHRLYERLGFTDCARYGAVDVPEDYVDRWRFMARAL